jgi:hypothetical protein
MPSRPYSLKHKAHHLGIGGITEVNLWGIGSTHLIQQTLSEHPMHKLQKLSPPSNDQVIFREEI